MLLGDDNLIVLENQPQKFIFGMLLKNVYLDLLCKLSDGTLVNVEIQLYEDKNHPKRIFTYASKIRSEVGGKSMYRKESKSSRIVRQYIEQCREEAIEEGRAKGREEGRVEGRAEGRERGELNAMVKMIDAGFLTVKDAKEKFGISASKLRKARALV